MRKYNTKRKIKKLISTRKVKPKKPTRGGRTATSKKRR